MLALLPAAVGADGPREEARERFRQAEAYFKARTYDRAIVEYQAAYDLLPKPGLLFNIGLCYEHLGEPEKAVAHYDKYMAADPGGPKVKEAKARRAALERELERRAAIAAQKSRVLALRARAAELARQGQHDAAIAELRKADAESDDPEIVIELAEAYRAKGDVAVAEVEYRRYLGLRDATRSRELAARRLSEIDRERKLAAKAESTPSHTPPPPVRQRRRRHSFVPGLMIAGGGAAVAAVGLGFRLSANGDRDALNDALSEEPPLDSRDPRIGDGRDKALASSVLLWMGGVGVAAGGGLLLWAWLANGESSLTVAPSVRASSASLDVGWQF